MKGKGKEIDKLIEEICFVCHKRYFTSGPAAGPLIRFVCADCFDNRRGAVFEELNLNQEREAIP